MRLYLVHPAEAMQKPHSAAKETVYEFMYIKSFYFLFFFFFLLLPAFVLHDYISVLLNSFCESQIHIIMFPIHLLSVWGGGEFEEIFIFHFVDHNELYMRFGNFSQESSVCYFAFVYDLHGDMKTQ